MPLITTLALSAVDFGSVLIVGLIALPTTAPICGAFENVFPGLVINIFVEVPASFGARTVIPPPTFFEDAAEVVGLEVVVVAALVLELGEAVVVGPAEFVATIGVGATGVGVGVTSNVGVGVGVGRGSGAGT